MIPFNINRRITPAREPLINRQPNLNPFGVNQPLPQMQQAQLPPPQQQQPNPLGFDFAEKYKALDTDRPNRLAYQQAIEQGPPEISRGKWAKLGAMLAAGGSALGGTPASQAAKFGISSYMMPQERADELYKNKAAGLAQLADLEDKSKSGAMEALRAQRDDFYKGKDIEGQNEDRTLRRQHEERESRLDNDRINLERERVKQAGKHEVKNTTTGESWYVDSNDVEIPGTRIKAYRSAAEQEALDAKVAEQKHKDAMAIQGSQNAQSAANTQALIAGRETTANIGADAKRDVAETNRQRYLDANPKAKDLFQNAQLELNRQALSDPDLLGTSGYIDYDEDSNQIVVNAPMWSGKEGKRKADKIRAILAEQMKRSPANGPKGNNTPASGVPEGFTVR